MKKILPFLLLTLLGSSCTQQLIRPDSLSTEWQSHSVFEVKKMDVKRNNHKYEILLYRFSPYDVSANIHYSQAPLSLKQWQDQLQSSLIINGAFFNEAFEPTAKLVIDGKEIGSHTYPAEDSGFILSENSALRLGSTSVEHLDSSLNTDLVQSFPVLIHPKKGVNIDEDSKKIARRTVIADDTDGRILIIIVDKTPISLYELAQILSESDLEIRTALNLDGGPSTGMVLQTDSFSQTIYASALLPQVVSFQALSAD